MSLVVEFRLHGEPVEMTEVAAALPDVTLEIQDWRPAGDQILWFIWASGDGRDRVREEFLSVSTVESVAVVNDADSVTLYRVTLDPNVEPPSQDLIEDGMLTEGYLEADGLHLTARVSGRDMIAGLWSHLREGDIGVNVTRLRRATDDGPDATLTDSQLEALLTAHEMGYFDDDERVTHAEIAAEIGISRSSLSERLRRAEQQLVQDQLGLSD